MLEGLEVSEITISEVLQSSIMRIEPEFYNSPRLYYPNCKRGEEMIVFSQYGTSKELNEDSLGYPVLRLNEFNYSFISSPAKYCNLIDHSTYLDLKLKKGDVLICRTNGNPKYVGKSALVAKDYDYAFASYLFRIRPDISLISSATLVAFLNSKYGRIEIERYSMVGNQANFSPAKFREINIPILPESVNKDVDSLTYSAYDKIEQSEKLYASAEEKLLECLGLTDFDINPDTSNVKSFKESFLASGRFDAEYYMPKYEDYKNLICMYDGGTDIIANICNIDDSNFKPDANKEYRYIELADVGISGDITGCSKMFGAVLPSRARRIVHTGDVVISSLEGSIDKCALVTEEYDGALCSTGFYATKSDSLNSETLLTLFKSLPIQQLITRGCSGAIMSAISKSELETIPLPLIQQDVQDEIANLIHKSFALRQEAKRLLDEAKLTVEKAILEG